MDKISTCVFSLHRNNVFALFFLPFSVLCFASQWQLLIFHNKDCLWSMSPFDSSTKHDVSLDYTFAGSHKSCSRASRKLWAVVLSFGRHTAADVMDFYCVHRPEFSSLHVEARILWLLSKHDKSCLVLSPLPHPSPPHPRNIEMCIKPHGRFKAVHQLPYYPVHARPENGPNVSCWKSSLT